MVAVAVLGIVVLVAIVFFWLRSAVARSERRSVMRYEATLGVLGQVSRRSDAVAPIHAPSPDSIARPHVGPQEGVDGEAPGAPSLPPRIRLDPPTVVVSQSGVLPLFGDPGLI